MKMNIISPPTIEEHLPFAKTNTFVLYLEPLLNNYYQSYQNVITLNTLPPGPLAEMVVQIDMPKLSPFQSAAAYASPFYNGCNCRWILLRYPKSVIGGVGSGAFTPLRISNAHGNVDIPLINRPILDDLNVQWRKNTDSFMGADDIPAVLGYLIDHGYKVDTSLTKMLYQSRVEIGGVSLSGDRKMITMVTWSI